MKKLVAAVAVVLVLCGMAAPVFAVEDGTDGLGSYVGAVNAGNQIEGIASGIYAHIARWADRFLVNGHRTIYATELLSRINAGERFSLLDIRLNKDYLAGHIPGAINIEFANVAKPEHLTVLPTDGTPIVVICYIPATRQARPTRSWTSWDTMPGRYGSE